jgi:phage FluMu protein Com
MNNNSELRPVRCTRCGHFFGFEAIEAGGVVLKCCKCKNWTVVKAEGKLTGIEESDIIQERVRGPRG